MKPFRRLAATALVVTPLLIAPTALAIPAQPSPQLPNGYGENTLSPALPTPDASNPFIPPASTHETATGDAKKNVLFFGDSIFANPTDPVVASQLLLNDDNVRKLPGMTTAIPDEKLRAIRECLQGNMTVPNELAKMSGRAVYNYACAAATGAEDQKDYRDFNEQIDLALSEGNLTEQTTDVLIQFGFNDYRLDEFKTADGNELYLQRMKEQIARIKAVAPNAKVQLVSYPTLSDANRQFCPVRIVAGNPVPMRVPLDTIKTGEDLSQARVTALAQQANLPLIDLKAATPNRNTCAPDSERWVAGIVDVPVRHSLFMHLTDQGVVGTAHLINATLN